MSQAAGFAPPHLITGLCATGPAPELVDRVRRACAAAGLDDDRAGVRDLTPSARTVTGPAVVEVVMSGEVLVLPDGIPVEPEDVIEADAQRRQLVALFAALAATDPLYLGTAVEWWPPAPDELTLPERWLPCDLWWSARLDARDPQLRPDLEALFGMRAAALHHGHVVRAGSLLDPTAPVPDAPLAAGTAAARRLARALAPDERPIFRMR